MGRGKICHCICVVNKNTSKMVKFTISSRNEQAYMKFGSYTLHINKNTLTDVLNILSCGFFYIKHKTLEINKIKNKIYNSGIKYVKKYIKIKYINSKLLHKV